MVKVNKNLEEICEMKGIMDKEPLSFAQYLLSKYHSGYARNFFKKCLHCEGYEKNCSEYKKLKK